ncbi:MULTISPECIES: hypothetical protein [Nostocales]|uniref:Uncharacterized protein n=3 Tax=Nostocales TaxID=1161 RepID=A0A0C1MZ59_9CYAN|nr:hypothetical protein [Tolypothrix bouteillei]KAF3888898.1 hypothetical protein DA73_0400028010 [Tolypothrix bouteillei VB521301]
MNRIIRLNAPHISSQSDILKKYCDRSPIETDLVSEMALIRDRNIASVETGVTLKAPIKTPTTGVKSSETAMKNTENRSVHIEEILNKTPKAFSFLATIRSIAFFTTVVVWSWTGKIEQVSQVRGKVIPLGEQSQILPHALGSIDNTVASSAREWTPIEVVTELNGEFSPAEVEDRQQQLVANQTQSHQAHGSIDRSRLLAYTRTAMKVLENLAQQASQKSTLNNKATDIIDLRRNTQSISNRVVSTASSAKSTKKLGQVYRS